MIIQFEVKGREGRTAWGLPDPSPAITVRIELN